MIGLPPPNVAVPSSAMVGQGRTRYSDDEGSASNDDCSAVSSTSGLSPQM